MLGYKNKTQLKARVREILNKYPIGHALVGEEESLILDILYLHEDKENKIGPGIKNIEIGPTSWSTDSRCFYIRRVNDSRIDFSVMKAIDGKTKKRVIDEPTFKISSKAVKEMNLLNLALPPEPKRTVIDFIDNNCAHGISGVYFLWEKGYLTYVGKSLDIGSRLQSHDRVNYSNKSSYERVLYPENYDNEKRYNMHISYLDIPKEEIGVVECLYIGILRPLLNHEAKEYHKAAKTDEFKELILVNEL